MIEASGAVLLTALNFILYFLFGAALTASKKRNMSLTGTVFAGLFFYYLMFTLCCMPVMFRWRPLHVLTGIWGAVAGIICLIGILRGYKAMGKCFLNAFSHFRKNVSAFIFIAIITAVFIGVVVYSYQFTLDASYYVGSVTTALQTDTINMYDPFTGDWLDHYEMRYFFSTFTMNDAVLCSLLHIHPLLWCKITISCTAMILTVMVLYMTGNKIFSGDMKKISVFILFAVIADFFMITIYTTSAFLMTRNYEGKCLLGNVVLPGIFYIYICLLENVKDLRLWRLLFLVALGAPVLSSSANMLIPAMIGVTIVPLFILRRDFSVIPKSLVCMLPGLILTAVYIAYVKNIIVFYTYPR